MKTDRERLYALIAHFADLAEDADSPNHMEYARTYALLVIARELFEIEGSLDTIAINIPP